MYSGCDTLSLHILFVYFLALPSLLHLSILFNCFLYLYNIILYSDVALIHEFSHIHLPYAYMGSADSLKQLSVVQHSTSAFTLMLVYALCSSRLNVCVSTYALSCWRGELLLSIIQPNISLPIVSIKQCCSCPCNSCHSNYMRPPAPPPPPTPNHTFHEVYLRTC